MNLQQTIFTRMYRRTPNVESLPWHREDPPPLLERAVEARPTRGRALDVGCGEGVYAVWLARQGFTVTGLDFVTAALSATRSRAEAAGVELELIQGDVVDHQPGAPYDVVLDSGCLHHLPGAKRAAYRARVDEWLAPGGDFVLVHFSSRPQVGWIPRGPSHLSKDQAVELFSPFELRASDETVFEVPFPMGNMRAGVYWFSRP